MTCILIIDCKGFHFLQTALRSTWELAAAYYVCNKALTSTSQISLSGPIPWSPLRPIASVCRHQVTTKLQDMLEVQELAVLSEANVARFGYEGSSSVMVTSPMRGPCAGLSRVSHRREFRSFATAPLLLKAVRTWI